MLFDVVIPVRNGEKYINRAIKSALSQDNLGKIIVVDDGSTDNTVKVILGAGYGSSVKLISTPPRGLSLARNAGIAQSDALWIAFLDSDDYWGEGKLAVHLNHLEVHPDCYFSFTSAIDFSEETLGFKPQMKNSSGWGSFRSVIMQQFKITGSASSVAISREMLEKYHGFDETLGYGEDWDLWIKLALEGKLCQIPEFLTFICVREDSMQRTSKAGFKKFSNSEIHIYEVDKYSELISKSEARALILNALWTDLRLEKNKSFFIFFPYLKYLACKYPALLEKVPFDRKLLILILLLRTKVQKKLARPGKISHQ